jgi:hypothetical protein
MGLPGDASKPGDDSWSFYTAQAESMGKKALSSTDDAIKTARVQINQLHDASSQHFATAQVSIPALRLPWPRLPTPHSPAFIRHVHQLKTLALVALLTICRS